MKKREKQIIGTFVALLLMVGILGAASLQAADYPTRKIEWNLWYGPGGGTDIFSRTIGIPARRYLKPAPLIIINIPGAAGANGMIYTMEQPADGYTITSIGNDLPINDVLKRAKFKGKPLTIKDFVPIIRCQYDTATIQVSSKKCKSRETPFKDIKDFVDYAKKNPGKVTIGGTGSAGFDEVVVVLFLKAAGIEAKYVPFDSAGKMHAQVLGGHIDACFEEFGSTIGLLEKGDLKALVIFKEERVKDKRFADIPVAPELGWDVTLGRWRGIGAKAGTPPEAIEHLHQIFKKAMGHSLYKAMEKSRLLDLREGYMGPKELALDIEREKKTFEKVLKDLGYVK
jgi:putative tricarboxylic transport membrane protein